MVTDKMGSHDLMNSTELCACVCVWERKRKRRRNLYNPAQMSKKKNVLWSFQIIYIFFPFFFHISSSVYVAAEMHLKCMFTTETEGCFVKENYNICNKYIYFFICNIRPVKFPRYQINSESGDLGALSVSNIMDYCTIEYTELFSRFILLRKLTN